MTSVASSVAIAPGQSRPLICKLVASNSHDRSISFVIKYRVDGDDRVQSLTTTSQFTSRGLHEPQRLTFTGTGGAVSYAILRPPPSQSSSAGTIMQSLPVLVHLHGAGLDADSEEVRHTLDAASDLPAWVIFPTGGSYWSGDDWREQLGSSRGCMALRLFQTLLALLMFVLRYYPSRIGYIPSDGPGLE